MTTDTPTATLATAALAGFATPAPYTPPADLPWDGRVRVAAWLRGEALAGVETAADDPANALLEAAAAVAHGLTDDQRSDPALVLEFELAAPLETIEPGGLSELIAAVEHGVHGLLLTDTVTGKAAGGWPSTAQRDHSGAAQWIKSLLRLARPPGARVPASVQVQRFTTQHAALAPNTPNSPSDDAANDATEDASSPEPPPHDLTAGLRLVEQESLSRELCITAASDAGFWLLRNQRPTGVFGYEFLPGSQTWSGTDSIVRQAGCAWSIAALATAYRGGQGANDKRIADTFATAAMRAVSGILDEGLHRDGPGRLYYLAGPDNQGRLGAIPLLLLAITDLRVASFNEEIAGRLTQTMLQLQQADGSFGSTLRGLELEGSERYFAGQITLALARRFFVEKKSRLDDAVSSAIAYYQKWWDDDNADLSFAAWMLQACESHYRHTADRASKDRSRAFAYRMADWMLDRQHLADHPNPLWVGGYEGSPGIGTAAYTEGMLRALVIATLEKDFERIGLYRRSVALALRFLLQLQVDPLDLAFIGGDEHRGAVRGSLRRRNLRCDNAQHFLMATLRAAAVLKDEDLRLETVS